MQPDLAAGVLVDRINDAGIERSGIDVKADRPLADRHARVAVPDEAVAFEYDAARLAAKG